LTPTRASISILQKTDTSHLLQSANSPRDHLSDRSFIANVVLIDFRLQVGFATDVVVDGVQRATRQHRRHHASLMCEEDLITPTSTNTVH
jgi:hypothetical protein